MIGHYLSFNRNCSQALDLYKKAFGAVIVEIIKYKDMPPNPNFPIKDEDKDLVLNATFTINGETLMASDSREEKNPGSSMYVTVTTQDTIFIQNAWKVLKEEGQIYMDLNPSFFANLHGSLQDNFGINWMFTAIKKH